MKLVKVKIHILSTIYNGKVEGYDAVKDGKVFSSIDKINVNNADYGYSIIYEDDVFEEISPASFVATVINLFKINLPDSIPEFELLYHYDFILDRKSLDDDVCYPSDDTLEALIRLNNLMEKLSNNSNSEFKYIAKSEFVDLLEQEHKREAEEEMPYSYDEDDDEDDDEDEFDIIPTIFDSIDHYEKKRKKKKKKDTGYYSPSKILRNNKNPKKMINRHGVVVNSSKKAKKQDEKTIKNFLKDFIPGNAKWKQNLRKELAKRWIDDFVISKKKLKKFEKAERNKKKKKKNKRRTNLLSGITNNLLTQDNNWFNPNK